MAPTRKPEAALVNKYQSKRSLQAIIDQDKAKKGRSIADNDTDVHQSYSPLQNLSTSTSNTSQTKAMPAEWAYETFRLYCINSKWHQHFQSLGDEIRSKGLPTALRGCHRYRKDTKSSPISTKIIQKVQIKAPHNTKDERGRIIVKPRTDKEASPGAKITHDFTQRRKYQRKLESRKQFPRIRGDPMEIDPGQSEERSQDIQKDAMTTTPVETDTVQSETMTEVTKGIRRDVVIPISISERGVKRPFQDDISEMLAPPKKMSKTFHVAQINKPSVPSLSIPVTIVAPVSLKTSDKRELMREMVDDVSYRGVVPFNAQSYEMRERMEDEEYPCLFIGVQLRESTIVVDEEVLEPQSNTPSNHPLAADIEDFTARLACLTLSEVETTFQTASTMTVEAAAAQSMAESPFNASSLLIMSPSRVFSLPPAPATPATAAEQNVEMDCSEQSESVTSVSASNENTSPQTEAWSNTNAQPQTQPPAVSIIFKTAGPKYSMKHIHDCFEAFVPKQQHDFIWNLALECKHVDCTKRPWEDDFEDPRPITMLYSILRFGPACDWSGTPFLVLDVLQHEKTRHHRILRDLVRKDYDGWLNVLMTAMQFGLHPKDMLPVGSDFKEILFGDEQLYIDNTVLDDGHARSRYRIQFAVSREQIAQPTEESYLIVGNIAKKGTLDVLQAAVEDWLLDGQILGAEDLDERLEEFRTAMRESGITTDECPALASFRNWLKGTEMDEKSDEAEDFIKLLGQLLLWRYPRSMRYGATRELAAAVCELDEDSEYDSDD